MHTISGQVTLNGFALTDVTMDLTPSTAQPDVVTDSGGQYSWSRPAGTYTVTPSKLGYTFSPASVTQEINANTTINFAATSLAAALTGRIVYKNGNEIKAMNADGSGLVTIYSDSPTAFSPNISLDGGKVIFRTGQSRDPSLMNFDGSGVFQLHLQTADPIVDSDH